MKGITRTLFWLVALIATLALVAAGLGVFWQGEGHLVEFTTLRGEVVRIQGRGLYRYDTVSTAAQAVAQDIVTLVLGIPLLILSTVLSARGSLRGKLLLAGTLGYFLYTYAAYAFFAAFNALFLLYTALFSLSLFALVLALLAIDVPNLPAHFSPRLPRTFIAIFLFAIGAFLLLAWLGRIVPATLGGTAPEGLESYSTLVIQALDLGLVVPLAFLSGVLLLRQRPFGYLLASVALTKGFTMTIAVSAMVVGQILTSVPIAPFEVVIFPLLTLVGIGATVMLLRNVLPGARGDGVLPD